MWRRIGGKGKGIGLKNESVAVSICNSNTQGLVMPRYEASQRLWLARSLQILRLFLRRSDKTLSIVVSLSGEREQYWKRKQKDFMVAGA